MAIAPTFAWRKRACADSQSVRSVVVQLRRLVGYAGGACFERVSDTTPLYVLMESRMRGTRKSGSEGGGEETTG